MKILHVIPSVSLVDGGPPVAVRNMTRALAARGHEVTIATTDASGRESLDVPLGVPVYQQGVAYWHFARGAPRAWKFSWPLTRWLLEHTRDFDVVHVHALFSYATIPACRAAAREGVPYVLRPLGTLTPWSVSQRGWKKRPYLALVERQHLRRAAAVHATSDMEAEGLRSLGFGDHVAVVPLGVDAPTREPLPPRGAGEPLRLLYLSRLHPKKGLGVLIGAVARLAAAGDPGVRLTIAGEGSDAFRAELASLVAREGLGEYVRFVGMLTGQAKAEAFATAHAFVLPSEHENFGIAAAEALAAGRVTILSDHVGLAPDVAAAEAGIITPLGDVDALAAAIARVRDDAALGERLSRRARALAAARFSWESTAAQLEELYARIVARRSSQAAPHDGFPHVQAAG